MLEKVCLYRIGNNCCAVDLKALELPVSEQEALAILFAKGYVVKQIDIVSLARSRVGVSVYRSACHPDESPDIVDCATFVRWLYGELGLWLPRFSIEQRELGLPVPLEEEHPGDLIFVQGRFGKFWTDPSDKVGHVGLRTGQNTVIHAANSEDGVVEDSLDDFLHTNAPLGGVRRLLPDLGRVISLTLRPGKLVEVIGDVRWDILSSFPRT